MAISSVTHKLFQTFTVNINSVCLKAKKEAENFRQIPSNITRQKLNCHISSQTTRQIQWDKQMQKMNLRFCVLL